jgi:hypothetical protein
MGEFSPRENNMMEGKVPHNIPPLIEIPARLKDVSLSGRLRQKTRNKE